MEAIRKEYEKQSKADKEEIAKLKERVKQQKESNRRIIKTLDMNYKEEIQILKEEMENMKKQHAREKDSILKRKNAGNVVVRQDHGAKLRRTQCVMVFPDSYDGTVKINVRRMIEEVFPVEMKLDQTVKELKDKIFRQKGIVQDDQLVDFAGVSLQDNVSLNRYGITNGSHLHVMEKTRKRGWITVFVKTPLETFPISLCAQSRLSNLKDKISEKTDICAKEQRVLFKEKLITDDSVKLETFGHGSTVEVCRRASNHVIVHRISNDEKRTISIDQFEVGFSVKKKIFNLFHVVPSAQRLFYGDVFIEDDVLMKEYNIGNGSILKMRENSDSGMKITITVKLPSGKELELKTDRLKSVYSVKKRIEEMERISIYKQRLVMQGVELEEWMSLMEANVSNGSKIDLQLINKDRIFVIDLLGKHQTVDIDLRESVLALKSKIEELTGVPKEQQRLIFAGNQLEDDRSLEGYRICHETTLHLVLRLCGC